MPQANQLSQYPQAKGFTLIELMIVVAIIGILSAIAVFAYQNYVKRSYLAEAFSLVSGVKAAVSEHVASKGKMPIATAPATANDALGLPQPNAFETTAVKKISTYSSTTGDTAYIEVELQQPVEPGAKLYLTYQVSNNGSMDWVCSIGSAGTTSNAAWVPTICRNPVPTI